MQREEPYLGLTYTGRRQRCRFPCGLYTVANIKLGTLYKLPWLTRRKVGMTSNHHAPYDLGHTRATMAITKSGETVKLSESQKDSLSSD